MGGRDRSIGPAAPRSAGLSSPDPGRRRLLAGALAAAAGLSAPSLARAQAAARVVVVGGGAAGAAVAKRLARADSQLEVTLVNDTPTYNTAFFSNLYLAGFRSLQSLAHSYRRLEDQYGVRVAIDRAAAIDRDAKLVRLAGGAALSYDRLVIAPGVSFVAGAIEGFDARAAEAMPHGYTGGFQAFLLRKRIHAMPEGGVLAIMAPPDPSRSPTAPYERASMAALYLSRENPRAKVLVIDSKDQFPQQALFQQSWRDRFGEMVEWAPASLTGGGVLSVNAAEGALTTGAGETIRPAAASVAPVQQAGAIAIQAGLVDDGGWAPVDPSTLRSMVDGEIFVLGDAARLEPMPKTAYAANAQAPVCAAAVLSDLLGRSPVEPAYRSMVWSFLGPQDAIRTGGTFRAGGGRIERIASLDSFDDEEPRDRLEAALAANSWYASITGEMFA